MLRVLWWQEEGVDSFKADTREERRQDRLKALIDVQEALQVGGHNTDP
jgi:hypothetical protein